MTAAASLAGEDGGLPVQILVDGEPPRQMWGRLDLSVRLDGLRWSASSGRADRQSTRRSSSRPIGGVSGVALAFEAPADWQVFGDKGNVVDTSR